MKHLGIERQTLLVTLIPILVMAVLLDSYFISTRFADLERSLVERTQLLTRQLASSCEYAVFSGNAILLKQNIDTAMAFQDVQSIVIFDAKSRVMLESGARKAPAGVQNAELVKSEMYQDNAMLRLTEPILATQIDLDGLVSVPGAVKQLGAVVIEISKQRLNKQKEEVLLLSFLSTLFVLAVAMFLAFRAARRINQPILQMHQAIRRIAKGDLETNFSVQGKIHELQELSEGINEMSRQLLRDRDMLELRIAEVTDGLRETKEEVRQVYSERTQLNENLAMAQSELHAIMEANPDLLYVFNTQSGLIQWNTNFAKFFGLPADKLHNMNLLEFVCMEDREKAEKGLIDVYAKGSTTFEVRLIRHDRVLVPYLCNGVVLLNMNGGVVGFTGTARDISESKEAAEHIQHMAHYDLLTDLPNRSLLSDRLQQAINVCKREHSSLALMFLDLDMFKFVNDMHGHDIGDQLLKEVAHRMQACLRESDTAARIGGDEFVVLLPSIDSVRTALLVAGKICEALRLPFEISGCSLNISTSIGVAVYPEHGSDERLLLKNADTAMYLAKQQGRDMVVLFPS